ncbi:hypothetical protein BC936DRAFT_144346 [Jimgerdemannia flammicorona]|uniref:Mediator of RNA polymerase II transcription subunit 1 n=1 Tax=Jimgerdemannia flammicorona TaxID=994334 RepID=A0A433DCN5_9FUNG|nr:hypothetical protein BC936DRAFT_144346 [Jimgerdemannia flammicorona]
MHQDDRVDLILAENLRSHDAPSFRRDLGILAHCDRFNGLYPTIDFFVVIRNLAADIRSIWQQEMLVCMDDFPMVLACGHGVPLLHGVHPGLSLAYWAPRAVIADMDWEELRGFLERGEPCKNLDQLARLWIQFEESRTPTAFLPPARAQYLLGDDEGEESVQAGEDGAHLAIITELTYPHFTTPCRFVQPLVTSSASAMLRFVAWVEPPVAVTEGIAKAIAQAVGIGGVGVGLGEVMQAERDGAAVSGTSLSLEELLIADAVPAASSADESQRRLSFLLKQTVQWEATFADTPVTQKYAFVGDTNTRAKVIERIPFAHPMQLFAVMQCLRQQLIFNALFQSCFNAQTYRPSSLEVQTTSLSLDDILDAAASSSTTSPVHRTIQLEIRARHPPQALFVTFSHPSRPFALVSLEIMVPAHAPVQPSVRVTPRPREADLALDEAKMTQVLRTCESVPVLVRWLCRKLEKEGVGKVRGRDELEWGEGGEEDPWKQWLYVYIVCILRCGAWLNE